MATAVFSNLPLAAQSSGLNDDSDDMPEWNAAVLSYHLGADCGLTSYFPNVDGTARDNFGSVEKPSWEVNDEVRAAPGADEHPVTYQNARLSIAGVYKNMVLRRYDVWFDLAQFESSVPVQGNLSQRQEKFKWATNTNGLPPFLESIPPAHDHALTAIFNATLLGGVTSLFQKTIPPVLVGLNPSEGRTMNEITNLNLQLVATGHLNNLYTRPNVGCRPDWYTDFVFAQQFLTGTNPTSLELASENWIAQFRAVAEEQGNCEMTQLLDKAAEAGTLYVLDYSKFRELVGAAPDEILTTNYTSYPDTARQRWTVAPVCIFNLESANDSPGVGRLHPLGIVIDYTKDISSSVVIFNKRLTPTAAPSRGSAIIEGSTDEASDWPWRYAKTCVQVADWHWHELGVHLCRTHLVEEAVIVAAHRSFDNICHPVYRILQPHWLKTLSVNSAARAILVPAVINEICGLKVERAPKSSPIPTPQIANHVSKFILNQYLHFDWVGEYIPNNLEARGFPIEKLTEQGNQQFRNYGYAKNMILMWDVLRKYVSTFLSGFPELDCDEKVANDECIQRWVKEMRGEGSANLKSFPDIKTLDQLIDAVTMCIHIASPQHTAINYTQEYYLMFVVNKSSALFTAPPSSLEALLAMEEDDLVQALPMNRLREWLLAALVPNLLSQTVAAKENLPSLAQSVIATADRPEVLNAAKTLVDDLKELQGVFQKYSDDMDADTGGYKVMDPELTAVSVLI